MISHWGCCARVIMGEFLLFQEGGGSRKTRKTNFKLLSTYIMIFTILAICSVIESSTAGWLTCAGALLASDFSQVIAWSTYSILQQTTKIKNSNIFFFRVGRKEESDEYNSVNLLRCFIEKKKWKNDQSIKKRGYNIEKLKFAFCNQ